jgi:hypothetical protein
VALVGSKTDVLVLPCISGFSFGFLFCCGSFWAAWVGSSLSSRVCFWVFWLGFPRYAFLFTWRRLVLF